MMIHWVSYLPKLRTEHFKYNDVKSLVGGNQQYLVQSISQKMYKKLKRMKIGKKIKPRKNLFGYSLRMGKGFQNNEQIQKTILIHLAILN